MDARPRARRSGDRIAIASYLGTGGVFDQAMAEFSETSPTRTSAITRRSSKPRRAGGSPLAPASRSMGRLELIAFTEGHLDDAGRLLAERHRRHRRVEPLLPGRYEHLAEARSQVAAILEDDTASGIAAFATARWSAT